jgi:hypothetical protein
VAEHPNITQAMVDKKKLKEISLIWLHESQVYVFQKEILHNNHLPYGNQLLEIQEMQKDFFRHISKERKTFMG